MTFNTTMDPAADATAFVNLDEVGEVIALMKRQEATTYQRKDYLTHDPKLSIRVVDGSWRQKIIEWMYGVIDHCSLRRDSVAVATYYLDLCVEKGLITSRHEFQLAAMTALQLAIKMYDSTMVKLDSLVKLGRGQFKEEDVVEMERKMLNALQWQVHPPTPVCFLRQFLRLLPVTVAPMSRYMLAEVTRFISEVSVCLYKFVKYPPSSVAYAGLLIAMDRIDEVMLPTWQRKQIFHALATVAQLDLSSPDILEIVEHLQHSLEKNVSLQELMKTIDAQCGHEQHSYAKTVLRNNSGDSSYCLQQHQKWAAAAGEEQQQHSPRDVTNRIS